MSAPFGQEIMDGQAMLVGCRELSRTGPAMGDDRSITDLVTRAADGDQRAWDGLVERYAPLVWSICHRYQMKSADAEDVHQTVWLQLVSQLDKIRDPVALPGWLAITTRRECVRVLRAARGPHTAEPVPDAETIPDEQAAMVEEELLVAERHAALREALARLSPGCQRLIGKLIEDPPLTYAQISASLGLPVGSIGPLRRRCLDRLRSDPAIAALIDADAASAGVSDPRSSRERAFAGYGSTTARALPPRL